MKYIHTLLLLLLVGAASAQSHYYIDAIRVKGGTPTMIPGTYMDKPNYSIGISYTLTRNLTDYSINTLAGTIAGVNSRNGETPNIRGARQDGTAYFVDGIRVLYTSSGDLNRERKLATQVF